MLGAKAGIAGRKRMSRGRGLVACLAFVLAVQLAGLAGPASAERSRCSPYPCYHTAQGVLDWRPSMVRPYDVAGVPLAKSAPSSKPGMLVGLDNGDWSYWSEGDLNAQGSSARGNVYHLSQWPYVDTLYYYSHNLLSVPPTVWTNAAHRQGVKVLGTLTGDCDDGACETHERNLFKHHREQTVDQLQRIAAAYGFDGWTIDIEQDKSYNQHLLKFMSELSKRRLPNGSRVQVAFYFAFNTTMNSQIFAALKAAGHWQSDYDTGGRVSDPKDSYDYLKSRHATSRVDDSYWSTYAYAYETGDGSCDGHTSAQFLWNGQKCLDLAKLIANQGSSLMPNGGRYQAPSLFAPGWTMFGGLDKTTDKLPSRKKFDQSDAALWRGPGFVDRHGRCEPANRSANAVSAQVRARPQIAQVPFVTRFGTGEGSRFSAQGSVVHRGGWNLLSAQDALPVAWCGQGETLDAEVRYGTAYDGGSSLHVGGRAKDGSRRVYLYKAHARVSGKTRFLLRYRAHGGPRPHVVASLQGVHRPVDLRAHRVTSNNGWVLSRAKLPGGRVPATLSRVGVGFGKASRLPRKVNADVGELRIVNRGHRRRPAEIAPARSGNDLSWRAASGSTLYYNVWAAHPSRACLGFIGRTQLERYDLAKPLFGPAPAGGRYEVQPVNAAGRAGKLSGPRCRPGG